MQRFFYASTLQSTETKSRGKSAEILPFRYLQARAERNSLILIQCLFAATCLIFRSLFADSLAEIVVIHRDRSQFIAKLMASLKFAHSVFIVAINIIAGINDGR